MAEQAPDLPALGALLEDKRQQLGLSKREAARRAGISEARWRQIVTGRQKPADTDLTARPRTVTVIAAARAVGVDPDEALQAAGLDPLPASLDPETAPTSMDDALRRILLADINVDHKQSIIKRIIAAQEKADRQLNALVDQLLEEVQGGQ